MAQTGKQTYIVFAMTLFMNMEHADYETYGATIAERQSAILDTVTSVVSSYTEAECRADIDSVRKEILDAIQDLFQSDFIYKIGINNDSDNALFDQRFNDIAKAIADGILESI